MDLRRPLFMTTCTGKCLDNHLQALDYEICPDSKVALDERDLERANRLIKDDATWSIDWEGFGNDKRNKTGCFTLHQEFDASGDVPLQFKDGIATVKNVIKNLGKPIKSISISPDHAGLPDIFVWDFAEHDAFFTEWRSFAAKQGTDLREAHDYAELDCPMKDLCPLPSPPPDPRKRNAGIVVHHHGKSSRDPGEAVGNQPWDYTSDDFPRL